MRRSAGVDNGYSSISRSVAQAWSVLIAIAAFVAWSLPSLAQTADDRTLPAKESEEVRQLREAVQQLRAEVAELKSEIRKNQPRDNTAPAANLAIAVPPQSDPAAGGQSAGAKDAGLGLNFLRDTTIEVGLDGYYGYNFNDPIGRVNLLRAYDVSSNAFSLNQANLIFKEDPDVSAGRRFGGRLDLQYGQATETLQGSAANEPRPNVYRPVFQAYGSYVLPVGTGLQVDFGKWASSLGYENNYSKDQINYSRSLWFNFLPFYHMGARFNYKFNDAVALNYWITNGTQQTEPFNGFKDQLVGLTLQPRKTVSWTVNYYFGQEHPDVVFFPNGGAPPNSPTLQGLPFQPIANAANGKLHIFDTYVSWQATPRLTLAGEADYVVQRLFENSPPQHTDGGAVYARYQLRPKIWIGARGEYMSDRGGLFSGTTQALKEATLTYDYKLAARFLVRTEWRRDFSNRQFFLTDRLGVFSNQQNTATLGLVWWWGNKEEAW